MRQKSTKLHRASLHRCKQTFKTFKYSGKIRSEAEAQSDGKLYNHPIEWDGRWQPHRAINGRAGVRTPSQGDAIARFHVCLIVGSELEHVAFRLVYMRQPGIMD